MEIIEIQNYEIKMYTSPSSFILAFSQSDDFFFSTIYVFLIDS